MASSRKPGAPRCSSVPPISPLSHTSKSLPLPCSSPSQPARSLWKHCPKQVMEWHDKLEWGQDKANRGVDWEPRLLSYQGARKDGRQGMEEEKEKPLQD